MSLCHLKSRPSTTQVQGKHARAANGPVSREEWSQTASSLQNSALGHLQAWGGLGERKGLSNEKSRLNGREAAATRNKVDRDKDCRRHLVRGASLIPGLHPPLLPAGTPSWAAAPCSWVGQISIKWTSSHSWAKCVAVHSLCHLAVCPPTYCILDRCQGDSVHTQAQQTPVWTQTLAGQSRWPEIVAAPYPRLSEMCVKRLVLVLTLSPELVHTDACTLYSSVSGYSPAKSSYDMT